MMMKTILMMAWMRMGYGRRWPTLAPKVIIDDVDCLMLSLHTFLKVSTKA